jgi:hypothetical protein
MMRLLDIITEPDNTIIDMKRPYIKRFAIVRHNGPQSDVLAKFSTIEEVVSCLNEKCRIDGEWYYEGNLYVDDREEDIEVETDELLEAWARGERPLDLSMF